MSRSISAMLLCVLLLIGCARTPSREPTQTPVPAAACPVTQLVPPETIPTAAAGPIVGGQVGGPPRVPAMYGNDALWVAIPRDGTSRVRPDSDGWLSDKYRTVRLIPGTLTAAVRRLDGPAAAGWASIPDGYGSTGFQSFVVHVPTEGCWEITQRVANRDLRFVVAIRRAP